jgi:hypothetical protein
MFAAVKSLLLKGSEHKKTGCEAAWSLVGLGLFCRPFQDHRPTGGNPGLGCFAYHFIIFYYFSSH